MSSKMNKNNRSAKICLCIFAFIVFLMVANVLYLVVTGKHFISQNNIREYADRRGGNQKTETLYAKRGTIYSSDNEVIASDVKKYKLYAVLRERYHANKKPAYVVDKENTAKQLAPILNMSKKDVLKKLNSQSYQVEFGANGNNLSSLVKDKILSLNLPGLEFEELSSRNYRYGDFASYTVGYAKTLTEEINGKKPPAIVGMMGIEKMYDDVLSGTDGKKVYLADNNDYILPNGMLSETAPIAGNDLYLTIDTDVQTELNLQMKKLIEKQKADKAVCAVMESKTGRILAISQYPSFDPNIRNIKNYIDLFLNEPVECGSVFKAFVYANALTNNQLNLHKTYPSGHFYYKVNGKVVADIKDHNKVGWGQISYEQGFYNSSNTAICQLLTNTIDKQSLLQDYDDLGFFDANEVDRMKVSPGFAGYKREGERQLEYLTTGFGQGSTVTAYQLLEAYSAFANDGKTVKPYFVEKIVDPQKKEVVYQAKPEYSKQIYSTDAVKNMQKLLSGVINKKGSTGYTFRMDDMNLIGKTGTGQVAKDGKYMSGYYTHSFAGLAPYEDPEISIVFWYQGPTIGNKVPAELVRNVMHIARNKVNQQPAKEIQTSTFILDSYINQSTAFVKTVLNQHQLEPLIIGNGDTVIDQYPKAKSEVSSRSRVFIQTNGTEMIMPSMEGWSRKEAEAFASMANVKMSFEGVGAIKSQSVPKGTKLKQNQKIVVKTK